MANPIETLQSALNWMGGYILIPEEYRSEFTLSDGNDDTKTTKIKSIVHVCEHFAENPADDIMRVKVIDIDDEMWDAEEYMDESNLKDLVIACGCIDNKLIRNH